MFSFEEIILLATLAGFGFVGILTIIGITFAGRKES
jgi:hypothetical protein